MGKFHRLGKNFPRQPVLKFQKEDNFSMNAFPLEPVDGAWIWN
jgi:hypothetical protein